VGGQESCYLCAMRTWEITVENVLGTAVKIRSCCEEGRGDFTIR